MVLHGHVNFKGKNSLKTIRWLGVFQSGNGDTSESKQIQWLQ